MIKSILKALIPDNVKQYVKKHLGVPSQQDSLARIKRLGFDSKVCIDIGAYQGDWTIEFKTIFPECAVLMIEGQTDKESFLKTVQSHYKNVKYNIELLGAGNVSVDFNIYETASSVLTEHNVTNAKIEQRRLVQLDTIVKSTIYEKPDFIKIDTQGYELEILKGAESTLQHAEFVLLEVSFIDIYKNCPLVYDVLHYMKERSFVVYDICTLMRRPLDKSLYQSDFLFVKEGSKFRNDKRWS